MDSSSYLNQLNEAQRQAVEYCDGAQLVIAGAGSGKTRVLTYKIAHLLNRGMAPWNILALTFTNKAAREMKERIGNLVGMEQSRYLNMGTFHSIFARILRTEASHIGYNSDFTIYDQSDSRSLIKTIIKEMQLDDKEYKASSVADRISMAKNHLLSAEAYSVSATVQGYDSDTKMPMVKDIYAVYAQRCRVANAMDFDDLLLNTYTLFQNNEDVRRKYAEQFEYVLVDEYQDTNRAQQAIILQLTREQQKVCVVGDDAQSIYSFRGANIENILNFRNLYNNTRLFKLEQNYRSTQNIVKAANSLIRHNNRQIKKDVFSNNVQGEKLIFKSTYSDKEEAIVVCADIKRIKRAENCEFSHFAILYRTNAQSRSFEECMRKDGIPYRIYGGLSFYQRKEIKDVIAYFRAVTNPNDEEAIRRIINYPTRGIGNTTIAKISEAARAHNVSMWTAMEQMDLYGIDINKGGQAKINAFVTLIKQWQQRQANEDAYSLGKDIIRESGISKDIYSGRDPEDISRQENIEELLAAIQSFVNSKLEEDSGEHSTLSDYLQDVSLLTDLDSDNDDDEPKVTLMTIHSAKGLEFPTVFIVGLEENIFPSPMCYNTTKGIEEERRLLYVAITRAERHCILTCAKSRWRYGKIETSVPSRFISEITPDCMTTNTASIYGYNNPQLQLNPYSYSQQQQPQRTRHHFSSQPANPSQVSTAKLSRISDVIKSTSTSATTETESNKDTRDKLKVNSIVEHRDIGQGTIVSLEGEGVDA